MNNPTEIRAIANLRFAEAHCLFANACYDDAFYIAGSVYNYLDN